jgi:hypothetical protein
MTVTTTDVTEETYRARATGLANMLTLRPERHDQKYYGSPAPQNECGTTCCVAGWGLLAARGIITIAPDGTMSFNPSDLAPFNPSVPESDTATLWREEFEYLAFPEAREWLGLSGEMAQMLFEETLYAAEPEQAALAMLRRLADGRLDRDELWLSPEDMNEMVTADRDAGVIPPREHQQAEPAGAES